MKMEDTRMAEIVETRTESKTITSALGISLCDIEASPRWLTYLYLARVLMQACQLSLISCETHRFWFRLSAKIQTLVSSTLMSTQNLTFFVVASSNLFFVYITQL